MIDFSEPSKPVGEEQGAKKLEAWICEICSLVILVKDCKMPRFFTHVPYTHHCKFKKKLDH